MPESLCNLYCLQHLNLSYNFGLRGWIPEGLGDLVNLKTLHLYSALLTGEGGRQQGGWLTMMLDAFPLNYR